MCYKNKAIISLSTVRILKNETLISENSLCKLCKANPDPLIICVYLQKNVLFSIK